MSHDPTFFRHFAAVGFPVHSQIEFERLLKIALERGKSLPLAGGGKYVVWRPGEGVELWVKIKNRKVQSCTPHFGGEGSVEMLVGGLYERSGELSDGILRGRVIAPDTDPLAGEDVPGDPLALDLPAFEVAASRIAPGQRVAVQTAALAHEMTCFAVDTDFAEWAAARPSERPRRESLAMLRPAGAAEPANGAEPPLSRPRAATLITLTARVRKAERRINPANQQSFLALLVDAPTVGGGTLDVAADPQVASGELVVGGLIHGTFRLTGHVLQSGIEPPEAAKSAATPMSSPVLSRLSHLLRGGS